MVQKRFVANGKIPLLVQIIYRRRKTVGSVCYRNASTTPEGILKPCRQTLKTFRKTNSSVFPVRPGQHIVVKHMVKRNPGNRNTKIPKPRKIRSSQFSRLMLLIKKHFPGTALRRMPVPEPALKCPQLVIWKFSGIFPLKPLKGRLRLEMWLVGKNRFYPWPDLKKRIRPGTPGVGLFQITGESLTSNVFASGVLANIGLLGRNIKRLS